MSVFTITTALVAFAICNVAAMPQVPTDDKGYPAPSGSAGHPATVPAPSGSVDPSATVPVGTGSSGPSPTGYPEIVLPPAMVIGSCFPVEFLHNSSLVPFYVPAFNDVGFFLDFNANGTTIGSNVTTCSEFPSITGGLVPMPTFPGGEGGSAPVPPQTVPAPSPTVTLAPSHSITARQLLSPSPTDGANGTVKPTDAPTNGTATTVILGPVPTSISLNGTVNDTVPLPGLACFYFVRLNGTGCIPLCGAEPNTTWNGTMFVKQGGDKPKDSAVGVSVKAGSIFGLVFAAVLAVAM